MGICNIANIIFQAHLQEKYQVHGINDIYSKKNRIAWLSKLNIKPAFGANSKITKFILKVKVWSPDSQSNGPGLDSRIE